MNKCDKAWWWGGGEVGGLKKAILAWRNYWIIPRRKIAFTRRSIWEIGKKVLLARKSVSTSRTCHTRNFKSFNKALNKKILFPLDGKSVSTSRNEDFVKKRFHLTEKLFSQAGISDKWKKLSFNSQKNSFYSEQRSFSLKIGLHVSIMVSTSKKPGWKNTISPRQERILQLLFLLMETVIEIRKNQFLKNNFPGNGISGNSIFKNWPYSG